MKKIAYVATPYKAVMDHYSDKEMGHMVAISIAKRAAKRVRELGYIPFSLVLAFNGVYDEIVDPNEREIALDCCLAFLARCDVFVWVNCFYSALSSGMKGEREKAATNYMRIEEIEL